MRVYLTLFVMLAAVLSSPAVAKEKHQVLVGSLQVLTLPKPIGEIVLGNPVIADIGLVSHRKVALTAKNVGFTSLAIFDRQGNAIFEREIVVAPDGRGLVTIYQPGEDPNVFFCIQSCTKHQGVGNSYVEEAEALAEEYRALSLSQAAIREASRLPSVQDNSAIFEDGFVRP